MAMRIMASETSRGFHIAGDAMPLGALALDVGRVSSAGHRPAVAPVCRDGGPSDVAGRQVCSAVRDAAHASFNIKFRQTIDFIGAGEGNRALVVSLGSQF